MNPLPRCSRKIVLALSLALVLTPLEGCRRLDQDEDTGGDAGTEGRSPEEAAVSIERDAAGRAVLVLTRDAIRAAGIETVTAKAVSVAPTIEGYGVLEADPALRSTVRAPLAGRLAAVGDWPELGREVHPGETLATLQPLVAPLAPGERVALETQRDRARGVAQARSAEVEAARREFERVRVMHESNRAASDRALEEARARLEGLRAQQQAEEAVAEACDALVSEPLPSLEPIPLVASAGGEVVAVRARAGEDVQAGAVLLEVLDPTTLLARITLPAGSPLPVSGGEARVSALDGRTRSCPARSIGPVMIEATSFGPAWLLRVQNEPGVLRPGVRVIASLPADGPPISGFTLPASAIVHHAGHPWVYVELAEGRFQRRAVEVRREGGASLVQGDLAPDSRIVGIGAELLLSHELLAAGGGAAEED